MHPLNAFEISKEEGWDCLGQPFNPPAFNEQFTEDDFRDEWYAARGGLEAILSEFGDHDAYGNGDYNIGEDYGDSRFIGIEVNNPGILTPYFFNAVQSHLDSLHQTYTLYFCSFYEPSLHILIRAKDIRYFDLDAIMKKQCGFDPIA